MGPTHNDSDLIGVGAQTLYLKKFFPENLTADLQPSKVSRSLNDQPAHSNTTKQKS